MFASHVFSLTSFWQFNFRNFANSVLRSFSEYNAYYHFIHQQCCLLIIKDSHNLVFASQVFLLTSFLQIAASIFLGSVLRSFSEYNAYYHFIHQQCCLLVIKDGHNLVFASQVFQLTSFSQFASSNIVISVLRSFEADTSYHFLHQRHCLLVTKDGHNFVFAAQVFSLTSFGQCAFRNFVNSVSRSFEAYIASYHLIHHQCCLLVNKNRHNLCLGVGRFVDFVLSVCF